MLRLLALSALCVASAATAQTTLYVEASGATGFYSLGVEQGVTASRDGARALSVRAGAAYWTTGLPFEGQLVSHSFIAIPVGTTASFALGRPVGFPLSADFGAGGVLSRRSPITFPDGETFPGGRRDGQYLNAMWYGDAALRAAVTERLVARAGVVTGGTRNPEIGTGSLRPFASIGVNL